MPVGGRNWRYHASHRERTNADARDRIAAEDRKANPEAAEIKDREAAEREATEIKYREDNPVPETVKEVRELLIAALKDDDAEQKILAQERESQARAEELRVGQELVRIARKMKKDNFALRDIERDKIKAWLSKAQ